MIRLEIIAVWMSIARRKIVRSSSRRIRDGSISNGMGSCSPGNTRAIEREKSCHRKRTFLLLCHSLRNGKMKDIFPDNISLTGFSVGPQNVRYSFTTAQIISRFGHRGSGAVERVLRCVWDANRRAPLCGERELVLVQSGHSTNGTPLSRKCWRSIGTTPQNVHLTDLVGCVTAECPSLLPACSS